MESAAKTADEVTLQASLLTLFMYPAKLVADNGRILAVPVFAKQFVTQLFLVRN